MASSLKTILTAKIACNVALRSQMLAFVFYFFFTVCLTCSLIQYRNILRNTLQEIVIQDHRLNWNFHSSEVNVSFYKLKYLHAIFHFSPKIGKLEEGRSSSKIKILHEGVKGVELSIRVGVGKHKIFSSCHCHNSKIRDVLYRPSSTFNRGVQISSSGQVFETQTKHTNGPRLNWVSLLLSVILVWRVTRRGWLIDRVDILDMILPDNECPPFTKKGIGMLHLQRGVQ